MFYDLIVLGGGPAGVSAALRARELGASVALVERNYLGGTGAGVGEGRASHPGCTAVRELWLRS